MDHRKRPHDQQTRRQFLKQSEVLAIKMQFAGSVPFRQVRPAVQKQQGVNLKWWGAHAPQIKRGVTWGVPWAKGALKNLEALTLANGGTTVNTQHWVTARWPDGSVKWSAHAAALDGGGEQSAITLRRDESPSRTADESIAVVEDDNAIRIRSEERRVGKECVRTGSSRWCTYRTDKKTKT